MHKMPAEVTLIVFACHVHHFVLYATTPGGRGENYVSTGGKYVFNF
jgi:hypothetical protein